MCPSYLLNTSLEVVKEATLYQCFINYIFCIFEVYMFANITLPLINLICTMVALILWSSAGKDDQLSDLGNTKGIWVKGHLDASYHLLCVCVSNYFPRSDVSNKTFHGTKCYTPGDMSLRPS